MSFPSPLALVGTDRQLYVLPAGGGRVGQVTWSRLVGGLSAMGGGRTPDGCTWPCWSPDGRWLAAFRSAPDDAGSLSSLFVAEVGGVQERELFREPEEHPIYAQWSPDGRRLGLLCQQQEELLLYDVDVKSGRHRLVEHGVPLFFTWTPDSAHLVVHAGGGPRPGRLVRRVVAGQGEDVVFPTGPGSFCAPLLVPGPAPRVAFATAAPGVTSHVCTAALDGEDARHVATLRGLLAVVPSPDGRRVAIGSAPGGESTPYDGIWLADLQGGPLVQVSSHANMAFFWARGGKSLAFAAMDRKAGCARWYRCDLGEGDPSDAVDQELCPFWPTRDQLFLLHFFEQYAASHGAVDPSGRWLTWATHPDPATHDPDQRPRIMGIDLEAADPQPFLVAHGSFATFGPAPRSG